MRRLALVLTLLLAGCAAPRQSAPTSTALPPPLIVTAQPQQRSAVIGMTAPELVSYFGSPALQVREGNSVKLQFRSSACVLDAYLYPSPNGGAARVTHLDARLPSGADTDAQACAAQLDKGS